LFTERFLEIPLNNLEISNTKHQVPSKSQIPISNVPNRFGILLIGIFLGFGICDLEFSPEAEKLFVCSNAANGTAGLNPEL
jgi:hypothetical protein